MVGVRSKRRDNQPAIARGRTPGNRTDPDVSGGQSCGYYNTSTSRYIRRGAPRNGINEWVNIKDPRFGATGNGRTDDTAAIQAAINYAFANGLSAVYCPRGNYVTSDSIWLDPPNNMRATTFTGTGYISGTTLTASTTTGLAIGSHIYGKGVAPDTVIVSGTGPYGQQFTDRWKQRLANRHDGQQSYGQFWRCRILFLVLRRSVK